VKRLLVVLAACHAPPPAIEMPSAAPGLAIELRDATYRLDGDRIAIYRGGALVTTASGGGRWTHATTIAAPDGEGRWVIALDDRGQLVHITLAGELEPVAEQLGLAGAHILDIQGAGPTIAARLADGIAVATDGHHLMTFTLPGVERIAVAPGRIAIALADRTELWDLAALTRRRFALHAQTLAFRDASSLVATSGTAVYVEQGGDLVPARIVIAAARADDPQWRADVAPVFARVCAHCHLPGGDAGVDLSTPAAWTTERTELRRRLFETRTMPPAGTELTDAERAQLAHWLH
jgi:mono/diheme cytochrome c family protein